MSKVQFGGDVKSTHWWRCQKYCLVEMSNVKFSGDVKSTVFGENVKSKLISRDHLDTYIIIHNIPTMFILSTIIDTYTKYVFRSIT